MKYLSLVGLILFTFQLSAQQDEIINGKLTIMPSGWGNTHIPYTDGNIYLTGYTGLGSGDFIFRTYSGTGYTNRFYIKNNGYVGIGTPIPNSQLIVGNSFGASISGSGGGNAIFGTNISIFNGGSNHNKIYTPYSHSGGYGYAGMHARWGTISFYTSGGNTISNTIINPSSRLVIKPDGKVGIGTINPSHTLTVNGKIKAEEIIVADVDGADFVFESDYQLPSLQVTENFIKENKHLPGVPSAKQMQAEGLTIGEMNIMLLQKIEELMLYTLKQQKELEKLKKENEELSATTQKLEAQSKEIDELKAMMKALMQEKE